MSHYKPYPAYKDSGVEWLGRVPEHWQVKQLKYLAPHIGSGKTPSGGAEVYQDVGVLFVRSQNVYEDGLRLDDAAFISDEVDQEMKGSRVMPGDVLLNITGASIGRSCLVPEVFERANVNQHVCIIRGKSSVTSKWISLCLPSETVQAQIDISQNGAGREGLNFEQIGNMFIALPHAEEVGEIANCLDRETARIDALIEKKTRFIELLREKRQALITHAVTKGLDPNVKMKDSGVEWLGEVPEHWDVGVVSRVATRTVVGIAEAATHAYSDSGTPILRSTNIRPYNIIGEILHVNADFADDRDTKLIHAGDLITVRTGNAGVTAVVPPELEGCQCFTMLITTLRDGMQSDYYCYWMNSAAAVHYFSIEGWGTAQVNISVPILKSLPVPIPPTEEQKRVVDFLHRETQRLDMLLAKTERSIELLKERRSALITAAVTGQIDLRESA